MRAKDITIGMVVLAKVGGELARCVVLEKVIGTLRKDFYGHERKLPDTYTLRRENETRALPKSRAAVALRAASPSGFPSGEAYEQAYQKACAAPRREDAPSAADMYARRAAWAAR